jgi:6-hydroxycyclohex-1-ene-1-carbonyl-CoA dehydrogenase
MGLETNLSSWTMEKPGSPLVRRERAVDTAALDSQEVLVRVAGCGVCHTDLGFFYDGVRTGREAPLTLGHEISGVVEGAGSAFAALVGKSVVVPAVIPCGSCELCAAGRGSICRAQIFPGSDVDGGFASHVIVPGRGLCLVDEEALSKSGKDLSELSVIADAVSTPYQAIVRAGLEEGDVAVFVGAGGVGGFGVQIARALGANVVAIDVDDSRLAAIRDFGASLTINPKEVEQRQIRKQISAWAKENGHRPFCWKIFETSGNAKGQELAFSLLTFGATLSVVGYTLEKITVRFSNLMAFDANAQGNWGCLPEHYPAVLSLVLDGKVELAPFIEKRPMSRINETFEELHEGAMKKRPVLIPDFA